MLTALILAAVSGQPVQAAPPATDLHKVVCKRLDQTGSRLGSKKICLTKAEWAERQRRDQEDLRRMQARDMNARN